LLAEAGTRKGDPLQIRFWFEIGFKLEKVVSLGTKAKALEGADA
jgi:hypothetical protein